MADPGSGPAGLRIRGATAGDIPAAMELFAELDRLQAPWRVFERRPTLLHQTEARYRSAPEGPGAIHLLAELDGRLVGKASGCVVLKTYSQNEEALRFWSALGFRPRYVQMTAPADELAPPAAP